MDVEQGYGCGKAVWMWQGDMDMAGVYGWGWVGASCMTRVAAAAMS